MTAPPPWLFRTVARIADALLKLRRRIIPRRFGIIELGTMSWVAQSVAAFCELGLPDALAAQPRTADELAQQGYGRREGLFRLLRALCAYDVVRVCADGRFALGRLGEALTGEHSAAALLLYANAPWHVAAYGKLAQAVRTGRSGFELAEGLPLFEYLHANAQAGAIFDGAMESLAPLFAQAFARAYDFSKMRHVVDIGGGTGLLLAAVLERFTHLRGTVFEVPPVAARVRASERLSAVSGNILDEAPPPADAYILSHVLHDWDDESCVRMLQNVRRAMQPDARVLVYEIVAPPPNGWFSQDRIADLEMLAMLPGRERTREEFGDLFARAGLRMHRIIATGAPESILEALL